jgi:hypothetical protein
LHFSEVGTTQHPGVASATTEGKESEQVLYFVRNELGEESAAHCEVAGPDKPFNNELQAIDCIPPGPMGFSLALYEDVPTMSRDYYFYMPDGMVRSDDSRKGCQMGKPSEGKWSYGDKDTVSPAGRLKCYIEGGDAVLEWTIAERKIYGVAFHLDGNLKALYSWWERTWSKKH